MIKVLTIWILPVIVRSLYLQINSFLSWKELINSLLIFILELAPEGLLVFKLQWRSH